MMRPVIRSFVRIARGSRGLQPWPGAGLAGVPD